MRAQGYDFIVAVDQSYSMETPYKGGTRWEAMPEAVLGLTMKSAKFDPDGVDLILFSSKLTEITGVTAGNVENIFRENEPNGTTATHKVIESIHAKLNALKASGSLWNHQGTWDEKQKKGICAWIFTDGKPDNHTAVANAIINLTKDLEEDNQCAITFVQVGIDEEAAHFLKYLDDELEGQGAKFDIVDTINQQKLGDKNFKQLIDDAFDD